MGRSVVTDDAAAVQGKHHGEFLETDIMEHLVIGPLQKRGIDGHHGNNAQRCKAGGEGHSVLLRDAHVIKPLREFFRVFLQARPLAHGRRDRHNLRVLPGQSQHRPAEHLRIGRRGVFIVERFPRINVKRADSVKFRGFPFGWRIALSLARDHVDENRFIQRPDVLQIFYEVVEPVAFQRAHILEAQFFKEKAGDDQALEGLFRLFRELQHLFPDIGYRLQEVLQFGAPLHHVLSRHDAVQIR